MDASMDLENTSKAPSFMGVRMHTHWTTRPWTHTHSRWPYTPFTQSYKVLSLGASSPKSLEWFSIVSSSEIPSFDSYVCHYMLLESSWVQGFTWHSTSRTGLSFKPLAQGEFIPLPLFRVFTGLGGEYKPNRKCFCKLIQRAFKKI